MNVIAEIQRINEAELQSGIAGTSASWHAKYADSAWVYAGNLPHALTEGDVICILSQFGEIEDINLVREEDTGKSKGFAFVKYEDARSCVLAVDNLTGSKVLGRSIRVDHVEKYRLPKHLLEKEEQGGAPISTGPGHAYEDKETATGYSLQQGHDLFAPVADQSKDESAATHEDELTKEERREAKRKRKEARSEKRREKEQRRLEKEEKRRRKRAKEYRDGSDDDSRRRKKQRKRGRSRSRSS